MLSCQTARSYNDKGTSYFLVIEFLKQYISGDVFIRNAPSAFSILQRRRREQAWFLCKALKKYSKDMYINVSFSIINVTTLPPLFSLLFLSFFLFLLATLEKSRRESRLHQLRHNVTQDSSGPAVRPFLLSPTLCHTFLCFATSSTRRHWPLPCKNARAPFLAERVAFDRETPYS